MDTEIHGYRELSNRAIQKAIQKYFEISPQYADDITWASTATHRIDHIKETIPGKLEERNLRINESKPEDYNIEQKGNEAWKKCKVLGSTRYRKRHQQKKDFSN